MSTPCISVIVPVYNAEKYIGRCIESILNQTLTDLELILVDDGSPDNSGIICDEYAKMDERVKVIHKENGGAASARNVGIAVATGEYIGFCDSDDYLNVNMYKDLIEVIKNKKLNTISCLSNTRDESGNLLETGVSDKKMVYYSDVEYIKNIYSWIADVSLCTRVTKTEIIKQIKIPEKRRVEDFYFTIALMVKTGGTVIYNYPYYEYTVNNDSVTHSANGSIYLDGMYFYEKTRQIVDNSLFSNEQNYFHYRMLYLLFISVKKAEYKKYKLQLLHHQAFVRKSIFSIFANNLLKTKEKVVLLLGTISFQLPRLLYNIKNSGV